MHFTLGDTVNPKKSCLGWIKAWESKCQQKTPLCVLRTTSPVELGSVGTHPRNFLRLFFPLISQDFTKDYIRSHSTLKPESISVSNTLWHRGSVTTLRNSFTPRLHWIVMRSKGGHIYGGKNVALFLAHSSPVRIRRLMDAHHCICGEWQRIF